MGFPRQPHDSWFILMSRIVCIMVMFLLSLPPRYGLRPFLWLDMSKGKLYSLVVPLLVLWYKVLGNFCTIYGEVKSFNSPWSMRLYFHFVTNFENLEIFIFFPLNNIPTVILVSLVGNCFQLRAQNVFIISNFSKCWKWTIKGYLKNSGNWKWNPETENENRKLIFDSDTKRTLRCYIEFPFCHYNAEFKSLK